MVIVFKLCVAATKRNERLFKLIMKRSATVISFKYLNTDLHLQLSDISITMQLPFCTQSDKEWWFFST